MTGHDLPLPCAIDAEQAVLGGVLLRQEALAEVSGWLSPDDFFRRDHRLIYRTMQDFERADQAIDTVTLGEWFESNGLADESGGLGYLIELSSATASAANVAAYAEIVREKANLRRLIEAGSSLVSDALSAGGRRSSEIALAHSSTLLSLTDGARTRGPREAKAVGRQWFAELQERFAAGGGISGLPTPWARLNRITNGLADGDLVIVAARPSMGKSAWAVNVSTAAALSGKRVLIFSLEMTAESIFNRAVASVGEVPLSWLRSGGTEGEGDYWARVTEATKALNASGLVIDDSSSLTAAQIVSRAKREHMRGELGLVVIDHLHCMQYGSGEMRHEIQDATRSFKSLAKALRCPVVVLSQLNRSCETRTNKRPQLADLRESGAIEQDADLILFLYRDDYYAEREARQSEFPGWVEAFVAKQREGEAGGTVWMRDRLALGTLADHDGPAPDRLKPQTETKPTLGRGFRQRPTGSKLGDAA
ncbi:replicative DNA helicase [Coralloluteibacterium thermophilus]|uniref:Replicative DNA helicase n=1 Tax=Coralloluteibacterium thermophilum TaxID=2707049 RepID=A0ABV9NQU1_9GAMM